MIIALMHQSTAHILSVCANVQVQNSVSTITIIELSATTAQWDQKNINLKTRGLCENIFSEK